MRSRRYRSRPPRRRRRRHLGRSFWPLARLWPLIGLALAALAAATAMGGLARRRRDAEEDESWPVVSPSPPPPPEADAAAGAAGGPGGEREPVEAVQLWIAGPAGNLYVRDGGEVAGRRLPVLFVHGLGGNGGQWALQLDDLRGRRRALALDLRGHGDSDPAEDGAYDVPSLARDVAAVADHFALRRFVLAGHSLGAAVAIAYAADHPRRVAGLLLVDANGDQTRIPRRQIEPFIAALRAEPLGELAAYYRQLAAGGDREAARWVLEDLRLTHPEAVAAAAAAALEFAPLPALARYGGPRLAVISDANNLPYSLHRLLPELPVELVRGTGHWLMMDRPEAFNRVLEAFSSQVS